MKMKLVGGAAVLLAHAALAQPSVTNLPGFQPTAVSGDGRVVVGSAPDRAAYWTRQQGIVAINVPMINGALTSRAVGVSGDGSVIAGCGFNAQGSIVVSWVWTAQGTTVLAIPGVRMTRITCISQDGATVGGIGADGGPYQSFVWTAADSFRFIPGGTNYQTWLHGLSADGLQGAGSGASGLGTWPTQWGSTYVWCQNLGPIAGRTGGYANGISGDGSTLVGHMGLYSPGPAFVWTARDGLSIVDTGTAAATLETASFDGRVAAGEGPGGGLIWVRGAGAFSAQSYFAARGVSGVTAVEVVGMSNNARVFVSRTNTYGAGASIVDLGPCGSADFNHDGSPGTDGDIEAFFACLAGDCCPLCESADFNYDGDAATDADIEAFFRVLAGGNC